MNERNNYIEKNCINKVHFIYRNLLNAVHVVAFLSIRIPSSEFSFKFWSLPIQNERSFSSSFLSFFFSFFTINKFHSIKKRKRSRNVEVNVSLSLSPSPSWFYFNCRLLGRDEPAHVALRGKQAAAKERARSIGHGSEIVSGRLCVPLDRQSNSTDGTRLVDWCCAFGNARPAI